MFGIDRTDDTAAASGESLKNGRRQRSTVLLIASLTGVFTCLIIVLAVIIARRRSRGNAAVLSSGPLQYRQLMSNAQSDK